MAVTSETGAGERRAPGIRDWLAGRPDAMSLLTTAAAFLALIAIFYAVNARFLSPRNITIILNQSAPYAILGVGMTLVIAVRGIDLSVGAIVAVVGMALGLMLVTHGMPLAPTLVVALAAGALCGAFNGFCVARLRVPPLIVTLGAMALFRGVVYVVLGHQILFGFPDDFLWIARGRIGGLSPAVYLAGLVVLAGLTLVHATRFGKQVIAVGGNEEAARLAGVNVARVKFLVFLIMGALSALAAMVWIARLNSTQASVAQGVEFHVIALVVLGGTSLFGGRALILGSLLGALALGVLENGLAIAGLSSFVQQVLLGLIFIAVVAVRAVQARRASPG
jgi:ribose transport system permease protein